MTRKIEFPDTDDLIRRYKAGESAYKLACEKGVTDKVIVRMLKSAGVYEDRTGDRVSLDTDDLITRYLAGESEKTIADSLGVNRWTIRRRLVKAGIEPRGRSDAELLKWSFMPDDKRRQQVSAAHAATRGRAIPRDVQIRMAQGRERTKSHAAAAEYHLAGLLQDRGVALSLQKAVDIYNLDIAIDSPPVAVEIFGGYWHGIGDHKRRFFERTVYLLNSGWHVIIVWVDGRRYPVNIDCADYIVALVQSLGGDIPVRGQYRVILGNGEDAPTLDRYLNSPAVIERLRGG